MGSKPSIDYGVWSTVEAIRSELCETEGGNRNKVQILINQLTSRGGGIVSHRSHKPTKAGALPALRY
jgi:hypothetical protein